MWRRVKSDEVPRKEWFPDRIKTEDLSFLFRNSKEINLKSGFDIDSSNGYSILFSTPDSSISVRVSKFGHDRDTYLVQRIIRYNQGEFQSSRTVYYKSETVQEIAQRRKQHGNYVTFEENW